MSADGYGILGLAAVAVVATPILIGGAVVAGTVYATGKLVEHIGREWQRNNELKREREAKLATEEAEEKRRIFEIMNSYSQLQNNQAAARQTLNREFAEAYNTFAKEIRDSQNRATNGVSVLVSNADATRREMVTSWVERTSEQVNAYSESVHTAFSEMKAKLQDQATKIDNLKAHLSEQDQLMGYASAQLQDAQTIMNTIWIELGAVPGSVTEGYNRAVDYFKNGMFEAAYGVAASVILECYDTLEKGIVARERKFAAAELIRLQVVEMQSRIEALKTFHFSYNHEEYEEDLLRFNPFFGGILSQLKEVNEHISDAECMDMHMLSRIQNQLTELDADISECIKISAQRLVFAYAENDVASNITDVMDEQGYDVDGYAYESGQEGQPIHINFKGRISGDSVTVILSPEEIDNTRKIRISVHDYGVNGEADAKKQDEIRKVLENALNISISCSNRGHVSTNAQAANLHAVEGMYLQQEE